MQAGALTRIGGEFADRAREAGFQTERLPETIRHVRILFALSAVLNTLFLISDWRFEGTLHFWVAVPARGVVIVIALAGLTLIGRMRSFASAQRVMLAWMWMNAAAVGLLVSSQSDIALFVVLMLPAVYWLAVPTSFRWTAISGVGCSGIMLSSYMLPAPVYATAVGFVLAMVMFNCTLMIVITRYNRLVRLEALAREELASNQRTLEAMFLASPIPMAVTARKDGRLLYINDLARQFLGIKRTADGQQRLRYAYVDPSDRQRLLDLLDARGRVTGFETQAHSPDGSIRHLLISTVPMNLDGEAALISGIVDITGRKAAEAHLAHLASTDPLTGLANRSRFFAAAEQAIDEARSQQTPLSVMMVDLDHFKRVNDDFGHTIGDRALRLTADLLLEHLPPGGIAARFGGEEFAMLLPNTDHVKAVGIAQTLRRSIKHQNADDIAPDLRLTVSIGCSELRMDETTLEPALARADRALYSAKRAGRNRVHSADAAGLNDTAA